MPKDTDIAQSPRVKEIDVKLMTTPQLLAAFKRLIRRIGTTRIRKLLRAAEKE